MVMHDVVMVVVNWNTPDDLHTLITSGEPGLRWSIYQNHHFELHEKNVEMLDQLWRLPNVTVTSMHGQDNYGHGYGINRAAEWAKTIWEPEYLFLINPDCVFTEPTVGPLVEFLDTHPNVFAVGPKQVDSRHRITAGGIVGPPTKPRHRYWQKPDPAGKLATDAFSAPTIAGSAMLVRSGPFFELGGMLEAKHYYSETWLNYHARAHGWEVWYNGAVSMIHEWHQSTPTGYEGTDGAAHEDRTLFRRKCAEHKPPIPCD